VSLTFKDVTEILKLIDASDCDELILELEGARLVVRRNTAGTAEASFTPASGEEVPVTLATVERSTSSVSAPTASNEPASGSEPGLTDIRAPMVGTYYCRPSPDEEPFVEEGAKVKQGDPLCLIEVMKLFTTIEAPVDGTVVSITADDGALVEFDQLLCRIKT
jgi:acetyl-CoA carboxylase biotin carboxyl carrier protein